MSKIRTNAELLLALLGDEEVERLYQPPAEKPVNIAFCCNRQIEKYETVYPHCGGDPYPF